MLLCAIYLLTNHRTDIKSVRLTHKISIFIYLFSHFVCRVNVALFGPQQPNNFGGDQDCLSLWGAGNYRFQDEACVNPHPYVCEDK